MNTVELDTADGRFTLHRAWLDRAAWVWHGTLKNGANATVPIAGCRRQRLVADSHGPVKRSRR